MLTNHPTRRRRKRGRTQVFDMGSLTTRGLVSSAVMAARPTPNNSLMQPPRAVVRNRGGQSERVGHE